MFVTPMNHVMLNLMHPVIALRETGSLYTNDESLLHHKAPSKLKTLVLQHSHRAFSKIS